MEFVRRVRRAWATVLKFSRLLLYYGNPRSPSNSLAQGWVWGGCRLMPSVPPLPASLPSAPLGPRRSCREAHTKLEAAFIRKEGD